MTLSDDDDKALFQQAMHDVRPLKGRHNHPTTHNKKLLTRRLHQNITDSSPALSIDFSFSDYQEHWVGGADILSFKRPGIQMALWQKLKSARLPLEDSLDLHGMTLNQALSATADFIIDCQQRHIRSILLIHGKGHYSTNDKPILKNALNQWLREQPHVLAFHSAKQKHGGSGALIVLLRKN